MARLGAGGYIARLDWVQHTRVEAGCGVWGVGCSVLK